MRNPFDFIIDAWLDQMVLAGFTAARWWSAIAMEQPMGKGD